MISKPMRKVLAARDNYTCQWCGIQYPDIAGYPVVFHHRRNRGMGGGKDLYSELVTVCSRHNQAFEDGLRAEPLVRGFRIPRNSVVDAETVPLIDHTGTAWLLTNRGTKINAAKAA